jgi:hypothetical protein
MATNVGSPDSSDNELAQRALKRRIAAGEPEDIEEHCSPDKSVIGPYSVDVPTPRD